MKTLLVLLFRIISFIRPLPAAPDANGRSAKTILLFSTAGIGDTLSDTPAIRAVKESFPSARVIVVAHHKRAFLLQQNPWIDEIISHRKHPITFFKTLFHLRRARPAIAVVLRANDPDIWPLAYLSGANAVVSRPESTAFRFLVNCPADVMNWDDTPGVLQTIEIVKRIGAESKDPRIVYKIDQKEREDANRFLRGSPGPFIGIQIHHSPRLSFRDWPEDFFVQFLKQILDRTTAAIVLTGGPADLEKTKHIIHALNSAGFQNRVHSFVGIVSLRETAALLEKCSLFVTTDTGVMHLAFAVGVPTLALLHPYNAKRVGPHGYGTTHHALIMEGPERDCDGNLRPLSGITPDAAFSAFQECFKEKVA